MARILSEIHYAEVDGGLEYSYSNGVLQGLINRINKIISFLSVTSLFAGINGFFKTYIGYVLLGLDPVFNICFVAFLVAFGVYSFDKAIDMDRDATNLPERLKFLRGRKNLVIGCSLGAYVIAMAMAFMDKPPALIIVLIPIITNAIYGTKLPGIPRLKDIPVMKNLAVAMCWA